MDERTLNISIGIAIGFLLMGCCCVGCMLMVWLFGSQNSPLAPWLVTPTAVPSDIPRIEDSDTPATTPTGTPKLLFEDQLSDNAYLLKKRGEVGADLIGDNWARP